MMQRKPKQTARWLKRHGFTNGLWRLEERAKLAKARITKEADHDGNDRRHRHPRGR